MAAGVAAIAHTLALREYVQRTYPEVYRRATFGEDSMCGSDFMSTPLATDPELRSRREKVMRWRIVAGLND